MEGAEPVGERVLGLAKTLQQIRRGALS